ncbi:MAG: glycosyltransferase family 2 protein [Prevotella sp.]
MDAQALQTKPLISFILTAYNLPVGLLEACIDSILALSLLPGEREIIVVDDGSDTPVDSQLSDRVKEQVRCIRQRNGGPSAARNFGLQRMHGEYVQFIDGDDLLLSSRYEYCIRLLREQSPDMVYFNMTRDADEARNKADRPVKFAGPLPGAEFLLHHNMHAQPCCYVSRSELAGDLQFIPGVVHEDEAYTPLLMLRARRMAWTADAVYFYRYREGSITNNCERGHVKRRMHDTEEVIHHLSGILPSLCGTERKALQRRVAQLTMDFVYNDMRQLHDFRQLEDALSRLRGYGVFPLPANGYTLKYALFRIMVNSRAGRKLMFKILKT